MSRRVRVPKTDLVVLAEAQSMMKMLYEDADAVYFETQDEGAEEKANQVGGLLNLDEG